jgi:hypothetical protein
VRAHQVALLQRIARHHQQGQQRRDDREGDIRLGEPNVQEGSRSHERSDGNTRKQDDPK